MSVQMSHMLHDVLRSPFADRPRCQTSAGSTRAAENSPKRFALAGVIGRGGRLFTRTPPRSSIRYNAANRGVNPYLFIVLYGHKIKRCNRVSKLLNSQRNQQRGHPRIVWFLGTGRADTGTRTGIRVGTRKGAVRCDHGFQDVIPIRRMAVTNGTQRATAIPCLNRNVSLAQGQRGRQPPSLSHEDLDVAMNWQ